MNGKLKWVIGLLVSVILTGSGFLLGSESSTARITEEIEAHGSLEGHPVSVERMSAIAKRLERMEGKLDQLLYESSANR